MKVGVNDMITLTIDGRTMQIPESESIIGCCGDNGIEKRQFLMPAVYKGIDIKNFSFVLKVQPVNIRHIAYYNELKKAILEDFIVLTWEIKKHDLVESGKLKVQLCVLNTEGVKLNSYTGVFTVKNSIPASQMQGAIIPPTIFEQAVASTNQAVAKVENALSEANGRFASKADIEELRNELNTHGTYTVGTEEGNIPVLGADGKLPDSVIPKIATTEIYSVNSDDEMENLSVQTGDICIRNDTNETYVYSNENTRAMRSAPTETSKWKRIACNFESESKQDSVDENLLTNNKTIVGAINEIYNSQSLKTGIIQLSENWIADSENMCKQNVYIETLRENDVVVLDVVYEEGAQDVWDSICRAVTGDGYITFYAYKTVPRKSIQIRYEIKK